MAAKDQGKFNGCTIFIPRLEALQLLEALECYRIELDGQITEPLTALNKLKNSLERHFIQEAQHATNSGISSH